MSRARRTGLACALTAALLVALAAPASAGDAGAAMKGPAGDWRTTTNGVKQTITFTKDGKVYGDSGCNRFTGGYSVNGDRMHIGPLASTMMACEQKKMDAEQVFLTRVQATVSFSATKQVLKLYAPKDMTRFVRK